MLCWVCFRAEATIHVLDRPSDDPRVESHYCPACYELKYVNPPTPADPPAFPLSRFTIKGLMIVVAIFALINAALALLTRSGPVQGTPAQFRAWTVKAFLIANPFFAILLVECVTMEWLRRRRLHKITGGVPLPHPAAFNQWEGASPLEYLFGGLGLVWPLVFILVFPRRIFRTRRLQDRSAGRGGAHRSRS